MSNSVFYLLPINPEPWAMGPVGAGRRGGKIAPYVGRNQQLHAFKEAVKAELEGAQKLPPAEYELHFWFWRNIAQYETTKGRKASRNVADVTNMQKATEDALQGILIDNDRNVKHISSTLMAEGPDVDGKIILSAGVWLGKDAMPRKAAALLAQQEDAADWADGDDEPF
jgi:Holliday junction resolvase RusA-like endonuclease